MDIRRIGHSWIRRAAGLGVLFAAFYGIGWWATRSRSEPAPLPAHQASRPARPAPPPSLTPEPAQAMAVGDIAASPSYAPRDPKEWQGMPVNLSMQASCDVSARCGLAMACLAGRCGPCARDADCAPGEGCAVQHCVALANLECRSASECNSDARCMLSGISAGARGNAEMHAYCSDSTSAFARQVAERQAREAADGTEEVAAQAPTQPGSPEVLAEMLSR